MKWTLVPKHKPFAAIHRVLNNFYMGRKWKVTIIGTEYFFVNPVHTLDERSEAPCTFTNSGIQRLFNLIHDIVVIPNIQTTYN